MDINGLYKMHCYIFTFQNILQQFLRDLNLSVPLNQISYLQIPMLFK